MRQRGAGRNHVLKSGDCPIGSVWRLQQVRCWRRKREGRKGARDSRESGQRGNGDFKDSSGLWRTGRNHANAKSDLVF